MCFLLFFVVLSKVGGVKVFFVVFFFFCKTGKVSKKWHKNPKVKIKNFSPKFNLEKTSLTQPISEQSYFNQFSKITRCSQVRF